MNKEITIQMAELRAEWAKAPFMTRQMAGAYVGPMLDLLETLTRTTEAQGKLILDLMEERAAARRHAGEMIAQAEAMQALPAYMIEGFKKAIGVNHGA